VSEKVNYPGQLVFGLDIGTRSLVGTVGYRKDDKFYIVAQYSKEHETRAMLDGQIHDIVKVGNSIRVVKEKLEEETGRKLTDVCIAAAGRVLRTVNIHTDEDFGQEREVTREDIYALSSKGIEEAYAQFGDGGAQTDKDGTEISPTKFYCVGYSVVRYYMNGYPIGNLEEHNAKVIGADMIATFLPDDVVDGLYKAVQIAGLQVINLTLEPIAAIGLAIPEMYRMLNIALVDVGAGTSDISITRDGAIIAFGMIPIAGDALTEATAKHCLVDFGTAEKIKRDAGDSDSITYKDIMGLEQTISRKELLEVTAPVVADMTKRVSDKIKELNGGKPVSAVFVVGGGGRLPGYTDALAGELGIQKERVAVRGKEVMQNIVFLNNEKEPDSLLVTPIGIALSFYEQSNSFIFVTFNGRRVKLYDNNKLAVIDAALQSDFPNENLFPKRGQELKYTVNGIARMTRGELGESAVITVNDSAADIHTPIKANDVISVIPSTMGKPASIEIGKLAEYGSTLSVTVNDRQILLPKFASVNGNLQSEFYDVQPGDAIEILSYYTVRQILEFTDVLLEKGTKLYVNNKRADLDTPVYDNFAVQWSVRELHLSDIEDDQAESADGIQTEAAVPAADADEDIQHLETSQDTVTDSEGKADGERKADSEENTGSKADSEKTVTSGPVELQVIVNDSPVTLKGKEEYVFVDVFEYIDFDLSKPQGGGVVTLINGREAEYMETLHDGDVIRIYWKK
jgi:cell division ATPase FtsA